MAALSFSATVAWPAKSGVLPEQRPSLWESQRRCPLTIHKFLERSPQRSICDEIMWHVNMAILWPAGTNAILSRAAKCTGQLLKDVPLLTLR